MWADYTPGMDRRDAREDLSLRIKGLEHRQQPRQLQQLTNMNLAAETTTTISPSLTLRCRCPIGQSRLWRVLSNPGDVARQCRGRSTTRHIAIPRGVSSARPADAI